MELAKGYGLVFGGGGAKGSYQIGVWKALKELQIPIIAVAGTSVGALNGALFVQDDFDFAYDLWTTMSIKTVINMNQQVDINKKQNNIYDTLKLITTSINSKGLDVTPLKRLINETVNERKIRESNMEFGFVTFSLTDLKPVYIFKEDVPVGKMGDYLLASASFPAFKPQEIDDKKYMDGALSDNIPISMMITKEIKDIIVVDISGVGIIKKNKIDQLNINYIKSSEDLGGVLDFNGIRSMHNIEVGYLDTLKSFGILKGKKYYLSDDTTELGFDDDDMVKLYKFLGIENKKKLLSTDKLVSGSILKTLKKYSIGKLNQKNVFMSMAEITAEQIGVERIKNYSFKEFIELILEYYKGIVSNVVYKNYINSLREKIKNINKIEFEKELKSFMVESKFLLYHDDELGLSADNLMMFRRFMAIAFPQVFITNAFIALLKSKGRINI